MNKKFKCIKPIQFFSLEIAEIGDILIISENVVYNCTKNRYFNIAFISECQFKTCLELMVEPIKTDADIFKEITDKMCDTFKRKNHDYGNSFEQSLNEEGLAASRIRMGDKWLRFKNLSNGKDLLVQDESLRDTLLDLAVYSIMTVMWMDKNQRNEN